MLNNLSVIAKGRDERTRALSPLNPGRVPDGWLSAAIGSLAHKVTNGFVGTSLPHQVNEPGIPYLQGFNVRPSKIDLSKRTYVTPDFHRANKKSQLKEGDILVVQSGHIGTAARVPADFGEANCHALIIVDVYRDVLDPDYVVEHLNSAIGQARMRGLHVGSSMLHINTSELAAYILPFPPLTEQRKIASILRTWDKAIERLSALRKAKEARLNALRASLLFGIMRMGAAHSNWPTRRLGEVTRELTKRNAKQVFDRSAVMGVSNARGIVPMREQTVAGDISRYLLLPPHGFAYNPMRINVGSIAMNKAEQTFLVSPDYVVFACRPDGLEPDYLDHLRQTRWWLHHINAGGSGSVRQRTYYDDLAALQLRLPAIEEQRSIVEVLNAAKADVDLTDSEIAALTRQKRGLMQKLLTGEWAVQPAQETAHA